MDGTVQTTTAAFSVETHTSASVSTIRTVTLLDGCPAAAGGRPATHTPLPPSFDARRQGATRPLSATAAQLGTWVDRQ